MKKEKIIKISKISGKVILWIAGIWLTLLIILQILLSTPILTRMVNSYAEKYIDGNVHFGEVSISMFRRFPRAEISFKNFSITYPTDRYSESKCLGAQGILMNEGCGETADTLISIHSLSASINLSSLLSNNIKVPHLHLEKPRIFAHKYADGNANWDLFKFESDDDTETEIPHIAFGEITLGHDPHIVYTDSKDSLFACIRSKHILLKGKLETQNISDRKVGLTMDKTVIAGRMVNDTLAVGIDRLFLHEDSQNHSIDIESKIQMFAGTNSFGRLEIPVDINGRVILPQKDVPTINIQNFTLNIAHVPIHTDAELTLLEDKLSIDATIEIPECNLSEIKDKFIVNFIPEASEIKTDAKLSTLIRCTGDYIYETGSLPQLSARFAIPDSKISLAHIPNEELSFSLNLNAATDTLGKLNIQLSKFNAKAKGLDLDAKAEIADFMDIDPEIQINAGINANLDSLKRFIPKFLNITAEGTLDADIQGSAKMSQLNMYDFSKSSLSGDLVGEEINIDIPLEKFNARIRGLNIHLGPEVKGKGNHKLVGITGEAEKIDINYEDVFRLNSEGFKVSAKNAIERPVITKSGKTRYPFGGRISAYRVRFQDSEGTSLLLHNTTNTFTIRPQKENRDKPKISLTSNNERILAKSDINRIALTKANISLEAEKNDNENQNAERKTKVRKKRKFILPEWLSEEDFRASDINITLDKSLARYFNEWDMSGSVTIAYGNLITPHFPLKNMVNMLNLQFNNDKIAIESLSLLSGTSKLSAKGSLTGLKRALLGRPGALKLDADITSDKLNLNEILAAYVKGTELNKKELSKMAQMSDSEYMESIAIDSTDLDVETPLIVIPANLIADIDLNGKNIKFNNLNISSMDSKILMKERCLQLAKTHAVTNMGDVDLDAFYSTRTKKDLKMGFSAELQNITAEKAISLMPGLDTIVPLLKSFDGLINCELAATSQFDTDMNIITPSINGVIRLTGENLSIKNNDYFSDLAKTFMFKDKKKAFVDKMTVEGIIQDNKLEVFPFILDIDRYVLGLSGTQNMDMSYRYHASLIKSPLLIRFGVDLYGDDFDNMKFKLCKAKYKNTNVPSFSAEIDKTKINLVESIQNIFEKGVDAVIKENNRLSEIDARKKKIGYKHAVDQNAEALSEDDKKALEKVMDLDLKIFD